MTGDVNVSRAARKKGVVGQWACRDDKMNADPVGERIDDGPENLWSRLV